MAPRPKLLQLRITLRGINPPVWRRLVVASDLTLAQLHATIQRAFGWENRHLHEFRIGGFRYGRPDHAEDFLDRGPPLGDERRVTLALALGGLRAFEYWYDFGDDWWHDVVVEAALSVDAKAPRKQLVAGERACPPEDCGGPPGYFDLVAILHDPTHPDHSDMRDWSGDFDPERFDILAAAKAVAGKGPAKPRA